VSYFTSHGIRVMLSIGGITYTNDWDTALATNGAQLGSNAAALAKQLGVGIEIDYENSSSPNLTGLQYASAAQSYFDDQGPDRVGEYIPWFIDIMPTARWLQLAFAFSLLFGAQAMWHRFRLWRLDARRVGIEHDIADLVGCGMSAKDILSMKPDDSQRAPDARRRIDTLVAGLEKLNHDCRRQSVSMLVPMGQEMSYRYQEMLIADLLHALRALRQKFDH